MSAMSTAFARRAVLSLIIVAISYYYFNNIINATTFIAIYLVLYSPTDRFCDEISPLISLIITHFLPFINVNNVLSSAVFYIFMYLLTILILTIITPRHTFQNMQQPSNCIIPETKRNKCGLTYYLENDSPTDELFSELGKTADDIADKIWPELMKLVGQKSKTNKNVDPIDVILDNSEYNEDFKKFVKSITTDVPEWCDYKRILNAQKLHHRLSLPFVFVLGICTLVGGFGCPEINKVLISSRYWANDNNLKSLKNTLNRLRETGVWLYSVTQSVDALKPYGNAWKSILRVRLFHCSIRYQLKQQAKQDNTVPINQLHLIATLLGFSYTPLIVIKTVFGIPISDSECNDYLLFWRYIGWVLGISDDGGATGCVPLRNYTVSRAWMAKIWDKLIHPDVACDGVSTTMALSSHVLKALALDYEEREWGAMFSVNKQTVYAFFRAFLTEGYADMINVSKVGWSYELQCRVIIGLARIWNIMMHVLCLNWLNSLIWKSLFKHAVKDLNENILKKKEKYHCRFAKYCTY